jgi:3-hydroxyacyl-[acyl-carrier-protein] dehydratase
VRPAGQRETLDFASPIHGLEKISAESDGNCWRVEASYAIHSDDPYLDAHFPGYSIFPGVFLIECVRRLVASLHDLGSSGPPDVRELSSVRFLAPIVREERIRLELMLRPVGGGIVEVDGRCLRSDGVVAARLRLSVGGPSDDGG